MVAIVGGNALGLSTSSLGVLGSDGQIGSAGTGRSGEEIYLNAATGNLVLRRQDELLIGRGPDIGVQRTYNSQGTVDGDNNDNWRIGFYRSVHSLTLSVNTANSTVTRTDADGTARLYRYDTTARKYISTEGGGSHDTLTYSTTTQRWTWTDGDSRVTETYDWNAGTGKLLSTQDVDGNAITYAYQDNRLIRVERVVDELGRKEQTLLTWGGNNLEKIETVQADGTKSTRVYYRYDGSNRLERVIVDLSPGDNRAPEDTNPTGPTYVTTYAYDGTSKRVASITQTDGSRLEFSYKQANGVWRVEEVRDVRDPADVNKTLKTTLSYDTINRTTTVIDALNQSTRLAYDVNGQLLSVTGPAVGGVSQIVRYGYDAQGNLTSLTDARNQTTVFEYDENGNRTLERDSMGNTVKRKYGSLNQLLNETRYTSPATDTAAATGAQTTRYTYDTKGHLRFVTSAEGRVTEYVYHDTAGNLGLLRSKIEYTKSQYDLSGFSSLDTFGLTRMEDWVRTADKARAERCDYGYDFRGQVQTKTEYTQLNADGTGKTDGATITHYIYGPSGELLQVIDSRGVASAAVGDYATTYTYDGLGRVFTVLDASGALTQNIYDDAGRRTSVRLDNGHTVTTTYDRGGMPISVAQSNNLATLGPTTYTYDKLDRLRMSVDPTGVREFHLYDEAGRKVGTVNGDGALVEYVYNANNQVIRTIAYANRVKATPLANAAANPLTFDLAAAKAGVTLDPTNDRMSRNVYDAAGRLAKTVDGVGAVVEYLYDGLSRHVKTKRYGTPLSSSKLSTLETTSLARELVPDDIVPTVKTTVDRVTRSLYDKEGLLRGSLDAEGYLTEYKYDAAGRQIETIRYNNPTPSDERVSGTIEDLIPALDAKDQHTYTIYNAKGQVEGQVDAEGNLTELRYDGAGNINYKARYYTPVTYTAGARVEDLPRPNHDENQITQYSYDERNLLISQNDPDGTIITYRYDRLGRLTSQTRAANDALQARSANLRYDAFGRIVAELGGEGSQALAALGGGATQAQVDAVWARYATKHAYDNAGRRTSTTDALGYITYFYYDGQSRLSHTLNGEREVVRTSYNAFGEARSERGFNRRASTTTLTAIAGGGLATAALDDKLDSMTSTDDRVDNWTYNREGVLASVTDILGGETRYTLNAFGEVEERSQKLNAADNRRIDKYTYDERGLLLTHTADANGASALTQTEYDAFGRAIHSWDANGNKTDRTYDRLGRAVATVDPVSGTTTTYDAFARVLRHVDGSGRATTYAYNTALRTMTVTTEEGVSVTTKFTRHGETQSIADGKQQLTTYEYDRNGDLKLTTTPLTTESNTYYDDGGLKEATDRRGNKVAYTYDGAGRVKSVTVDPGGLNLVTDYEYDGRGNTIEINDPRGVITAITFDRNSRTLTRTVDSGGLNLQTVYSYDLAGRTLSVTEPGNKRTEYVYDALGRRTKETIDPGLLDIVTEYKYDDNGNVVMRTDDTGGRQLFAYDARDRLIYSMDQAGGITRKEYDGADRLTRSTRYAQRASTAGTGEAPFNALIASRIVATPGKDAVDARVYDRDGRLRFTVDGTGAVVRYTYDKNNNVTERVAYVNTINLAAWDGFSNPPVVADAARDNRTRTVYDALDRVWLVVDATGAVKETFYDAAGNITGTKEYANVIGSPAEGAVDQKTVVLNGEFGYVTGVNHAPIDTTKTYKISVRLRQLTGVGTIYAGVSTKDSAGNLITNPHSGTFVYAATQGGVTLTPEMGWVTYEGMISGEQAINALSGYGRFFAGSKSAAPLLLYNYYGSNGDPTRLLEVDSLVMTEVGSGAVLNSGADMSLGAGSLSVLGAGGVVATHSGDSPTLNAGEVQARLRPDTTRDRVTSYTYDAANRLIWKLEASGAVTQYEYDAAGNVTKQRQYAKIVTGADPTVVVSDSSNDRITTMKYDKAGRLTYVSDALGYVTTHQYLDAARTQVTTRHFNKSSSTPAASEFDQTETREFDAAGRVARITDSYGKYDHYAYDGLGNKLSFTNKKGGTWNYTYDAAGRLETETSPEVDVGGSVRIVQGNIPVGAFAGAPARIVTRLGYDGLGQLISRIEAEGRAEQRTTSYEYDAAGRQIAVIHPRVVVYVAESMAALAANGASWLATGSETMFTPTTRTFYDGLGNAIAGVDTAGNRSYKAYDAMGRVRYSVDAMGYVTGYRMNAFGETDALTRYAVAYTSFVPGGAVQGPTVAQVEAALQGFNHSEDRVIMTIYDKMGRVAEVIEPRTYTYNSDSNIYEDTEPRTRNIYNAFGDLIRTSKLLNATADLWTSTTNYYDKLGRIASTVDALGYVTKNEYDAVGNLSSRNEYARELDAGTWDLVSRASVRTGSNDRSTRYVYDKLNRKIEEIKEDVTYSAASDGTRIVDADISTKYGYDAVGNLTRTTDAKGGNTYTYFDALGRITAVAAPTRTAGTYSGLPVTPLTVFYRDAHGNVLVKMEYQAGAAAAGEFTGVSRAANPGYTPGLSYPQNIYPNRVTSYTYDSHGRVIVTTDAANHKQYISYNERGQIAKTWEGVGTIEPRPDASTVYYWNYEKTKFQVYQYDKLGRLTHTIDPASTGVYQAGATIRMFSSAGPVDVYGPEERFFDGLNSVDVAWSSLTDPLGGNVFVQLDYWTSQDSIGGAQLKQQHREVSAKAASGGLLIEWPDNETYHVGGISQVHYVRVYQQQSDGSWRGIWEGDPSATGGTVNHVSQAQAGTTDTAMEYNAFGEIVRKGINGGRQEYFTYDNAGRMWKSNDGGVDKILLHDLQQRVTAQLTSDGWSVALSTLSREQALDRPTLRRTDMKYDLLGRVLEQSRPVTEAWVDDGRVVRQTASIDIVSSASMADYGDGFASWGGENRIDISWPSSLASLGMGDLKIELKYWTGYFVYGGGYYSTPVVKHQLGRMLPNNDPNGATSLSFIWHSGDLDDGGIDRVESLTIYKKDAEGVWRKVIEATPQDTISDELHVRAPADPATVVELQIRPPDSTSDSDWTVFPRTGESFGEMIRYDLDGLGVAGYQYRLRYTLNGQSTFSSIKILSAYVYVPPPPDRVQIHPVWTPSGQYVQSRPIVTQEVDRWGNVLSITDPRNAAWKTTYRYDWNNRLIKETKPGGLNITEWFYDQFGQQVAVKDANGFVNGFIYDAGGHLIEQRQQENQHAEGWGRIKHYYDAFGQRRYTTDAVGNAQGATAAVQAAHSTFFAYDLRGNLVITQHGFMNVWSVDGASNSTYTVRAIEELYTYDSLNRKTSQKDGALNTTHYRYDLAGNIIETTRPMGQKVKYIYDAYGHKTVEVDENGMAMLWSYDYFGRLKTHTDLGGGRYRYEYDYAGQLVAVYNSRYSIEAQKNYVYHGSGLLALEYDFANSQTMQYEYDAAGNRVRESISKDSATYQENEMIYDSLGRLKETSNGAAHVEITYDKVGNRTRIETSLRMHRPGTMTQETIHNTDEYFRYDSQNRQIGVGLDYYGNIGTQGHLLTYDLNGNRISDKFYGNRVVTNPGYDYIYGYSENGEALYDYMPVEYTPQSGEVVERYVYDGLNRVVSIEREGIQIDRRGYDGAGRVLVNGPPANLPPGYMAALNSGVPAGQETGLEQRRYRYDENGRLLQQWNFNSDGSSLNFYVRNEYDAAGNVIWSEHTAPNRYTVHYTYWLNRFDSYKEGQVRGSSAQFTAGTTLENYDVNGHLVYLWDTHNASRTRTFYNDSQGRAILTQLVGGHLWQFIVNGEVLGHYGYPSGAVFDFAGYRSINANYPVTSSGNYTVQSGDTLRGIARTVFGDETLWYLIADANNLSSDSDLRVGQTLTIPNKVSSVYNGADAFKPYDPSVAIGSTLPDMLPPPGPKGCGTFGLIVVIIIAIVVTYFSYGYLAEAGAGMIAAAAGAGAAGSLASQVVATAIGMQDGINWKQVGIAAIANVISAGVGQWIGPTIAGSTTAAAAAQAAIASAATQGIAVMMGVQEKFDWRAVAAAAITSGIGAEMKTSPGIDNSLNELFGNPNAAAFAAGALRGLVTTVASTIVRGGKVSRSQILSDAFGNAIGEGIVAANSMGTTRPSVPTTNIDNDALPQHEVDAILARDYGNQNDWGSNISESTMQRVHRGDTRLDMGEYYQDGEVDSTGAVRKHAARTGGSDARVSKAAGAMSEPPAGSPPAVTEHVFKEARPAPATAAYQRADMDVEPEYDYWDFGDPPGYMPSDPPVFPDPAPIAGSVKKQDMEAVGKFEADAFNRRGRGGSVTIATKDGKSVSEGEFTVAVGGSTDARGSKKNGEVRFAPVVVLQEGNVGDTQKPGTWFFGLKGEIESRTGVISSSKEARIGVQFSGLSWEGVTFFTGIQLETKMHVDPNLQRSFGNSGLAGQLGLNLKYIANEAPKPSVWDPKK